MEPQQEQIAPEIVQAIQSQASARGLSVNDYLRLALGLKNGNHVAEQPLYETATPAELAVEIAKWMDSHDPNTPALPLEAVSRENIYSDR